MKKRSTAHPPRATVIVPAYNAEKTIKECVHSLLALDYPKNRVEFLLVDNGSTDKTHEILNSYPDKICVLNESKKGPAAARNAGLSRARGEVVAFTDADCRVDPKWLRFLVGPLRDERVGAVGGLILSKNPSRPVEKFGDIIHDHRRAIREFTPPYVISMNWASRLSTLRAAGGFDESFLRGEDVDLSYRLFRRGFRLAYEPRARVFHGNPGTLPGLFKKGYAHGFYSVKILKVHRDFLRKCGHRRYDWRTYAALCSRLKDYLRDTRRRESLYHFLLDSGKKIGKWVGSLRFFHIDI